jgi:23S rRNA pseudouridine1911/1915/1917 synthase
MVVKHGTGQGVAGFSFMTPYPGNEPAVDVQRRMNRDSNIIVDASDAGQRIDTFLAVKTGITRSQVQKLVERGGVLVNGMPVPRSYRVKVPDHILLATPAEETGELTPEPIPIEILHQDGSVVVVNKPPSMVVYPAAGHGHGTLVNALAHHCERLASIGAPLRPGVVHRLDKDTSGVMVVAADDRAYYDLVEQFRHRTIKRKYIALVWGNIKADAGEIDRPIGRSLSDRKKMSTKVRKGKEAVTRWKVLERFGVATLLEVRLGTGRTHQIRVHLSSIGYPVLGDKTYGRKTVLETGGRKISFPRQMLHAAMLGFTHPGSGEYMEFSSPLPNDMQRILKALSEGEAL